MSPRRASRFAVTPPSPSFSASSSGSPSSGWEPSPENLPYPVRDETLEAAADPSFPSPHAFALLVHDYLTHLSKNKFEKALLSQDMYDRIYRVLLDPSNTRQETAQFRFWVKKMFHLETYGNESVVCHDKKPVAVREQIYEVLVHCHREAGHGGRDKTSHQVRRYYSWIPKEIIARFVRTCPLCQSRRTHSTPGGVSSSQAFFRSLHDEQLPRADRRIVSLAQARASAAAMGHVPTRRRSRQHHMIGDGSAPSTAPSSRRGSAIDVSGPYARPAYASYDSFNLPSTTASAGASAAPAGYRPAAPRFNSYDAYDPHGAGAGSHLNIHALSVTVDMDRRASEGDGRPATAPAYGGYPFCSVPMVRETSASIAPLSPASASAATFDHAAMAMSIGMVDSAACHFPLEHGWSLGGMPGGAGAPYTYAPPPPASSTSSAPPSATLPPPHMAIAGWEPEAPAHAGFDSNNLFDVGALHGLGHDQVAALAADRPDVLASLHAHVPADLAGAAEWKLPFALPDTLQLHDLHDLHGLHGLHGLPDFDAPLSAASVHGFEFGLPEFKVDAPFDFAFGVAEQGDAAAADTASLAGASDVPTRPPSARPLSAAGSVASFAAADATDCIQTGAGEETAAAGTARAGPETAATACLAADALAMPDLPDLSSLAALARDLHAADAHAHAAGLAVTADAHLAHVDLAALVEAWQAPFAAAS